MTRFDPAICLAPALADRVKPKAFQCLTPVSELDALIVGSVQLFAGGPSMIGHGVGLCRLSRTSLS